MRGYALLVGVCMIEFFAAVPCLTCNMQDANVSSKLTDTCTALPVPVILRAVRSRPMKFTEVNG